MSNQPFSKSFEHYKIPCYTKHCGNYNENKYEIVRQYRKAAEKLSLEVPAGKIDNGEDPLETARRELKEETGLQAEKLLYLNGLYPSFAISDEIIHLFLATGLTEGESNLDEGEFLAVEKVPVKALREMILDGTIQDMKTIAAVFYAEKYMKEK